MEDREDRNGWKSVNVGGACLLFIFFSVPDRSSYKTHEDQNLEVAGRRR